MPFQVLEKVKYFFFIGIFSVSGLSIVAVQYFRNGSTSESMDKLIVFSALSLSFLFVVFYLLDINKPKNALILNFTSLIILFYGINKREN